VPDRPLTISTHVLDTAAGTPASGIRVTLYRGDGDEEEVVGRGTTDGDGRIARLLDGELVAGDYRIEFDVSGRGELFTSAEFRFRVTDTSRHLHIPLLLAPYSMTTYRGS
jgi:5-hydroxyisourate hydrolase